MLLWETELPALELVPPPAEQEFGPAQLRESADFVRVLRALWIGATAAQLVTLALLASAAPRLESRLRGGRLLRGLALLALALLAVLLLLVRWIGRFSWGRRLYRVQPFRALDWLYRAFVKT